MLYVESRKKFEVKSGKTFNYLPSVKKHSANHNLCRVPKIIHSAKISLPSAKNSTLGKKLFGECIYFAECFFGTLDKDLMCLPETIHSAKVQHWGTQKFPVVIATLYA